jgi:hypothetical protein
MPPLTLNQAAKEAGKSKQTLLDAIRGGRLSAPKDGQGRYQIDPAELFRVYPATGQPTSPEPVSETGTDHPRQSTETAFFERIIAGLESERDDLRRRLDQSEEAREREAAERREAQAKLTALLTYQPKTGPTEEPAPEPRPTQAAYLGASVRFWFALAFVATSAAARLWWTG